MSSLPQTRRTRFVCVSDTHNTYPKLPKGDVLIHAGDLTNQGSLSEVSKAIKWLEEADYECKIVIAGNHDITLDREFYAQYGSYFHNKDIQDPETCISLFASSTSITYLNHEGKEIRLANPDGPQTTFKIFGSPYSPSRGLWAFGYAQEDASALWEHIPLDTDIVVTHTPAKLHRDQCGTRGAAGCEELRRALWRIRPRLAVCGHIHEARGVEVVKWDLDSPNVKFKESETLPLPDKTVGSRKQFCVNLSSKSDTPLRNDGAPSDYAESSLACRMRGMKVLETDDVTDDNEEASAIPPLPLLSPRPKPAFPAHELAAWPTSAESKPPVSAAGHLATRGQGGLPSRGQCDQEALPGRMGRLETCFVNAAIIASNWPHKAGKKFNKPVVIDVDLPIALEPASEQFKREGHV